jgi:HlyD family secretion protein
MKKKIFLTLGILLGLAVVGFFTFPWIRTRLRPGVAQSSFQTEAAKKGSVTVSVGATGTVRANQTATVLWQTSGRVAKVSVEKGQRVAADAVLAELEQTSLSQNIIQAQADLVSAQTALDKALTNTEARANAHLALVQAQQALDDAEKKAQSKLFQRASQETIDIARANLINANQALDSAEEIYNQVKGRGESDPVYAAGLSQYARARQEQLKAEYNLRYTQELPDPLAVEEVDAKLEQAKAQLLTAKQNWEKVKNGPNADDIASAQVRVAAAQATLNLAHVSAPFGGTITQTGAQVGDLVSAGKTAFQVDDLSRLLVDVEISEVDINQVEIDQPVTLTFDAIPGQEYGGYVDDIASVGATSGGTVNFIVTVEISDPSPEIKPGMTAAASITVNQLDNVLLVLSRAVRTVNGKRVVYVLRNNLPVPVDISLGASANNYSQITKGDLQEGDLILLNPPSSVNMMGPGAVRSGPMGGGGK